MGAFTARKVIMREDIGAPVDDGPPQPWPSPNIWPTVTYPQPAGIAHVNTRPDGVYGVTKSVATMKVHMRPLPWLDITPHPSLWAQGKLEAALREMTRTRPVKLATPDGTITLKAMRSANWRQHHDSSTSQKLRSDFAKARAEKALVERAAKINEKLAEMHTEPQE